MAGELTWVGQMVGWFEDHWKIVGAVLVMLGGYYTAFQKQFKRFNAMDRRLRHIEENHCSESAVDNKIEDCHLRVLDAFNEGMEQNTARIMDCIACSKIDRIQEEIDKLEWKKETSTLNDMESWELKKLQSKLNKLSGGSL